MVVMIARVSIKPDKLEQSLSEANILIEATRKEAGVSENHRPSPGASELRSNHAIRAPMAAPGGGAG